MYRWLELDAAVRLPAAADAYEHGISLSGCSKATGGPGLRIGWIATQDAACKGGVHRVMKCFRAAAGAGRVPRAPAVAPILPPLSPPRPVSLLYCSPILLAVVRRVLELKDYTSICSSAPSEILALIMLRK